METARSPGEPLARNQHNQPKLAPVSGGVAWHGQAMGLRPEEIAMSEIVIDDNSNTMIKAIYADMSARLSKVGLVVIAGGAVRDSLLGVTAKDFDVFISCKQTDSVKIPMAMDGLERIEVPEYHKSEPFLLGTWKVRGQYVQVMWTPHNSIAELVASFDWNVSLFAYDGRFHCFEDIANISSGKPLRIQKITFPASSLRRGFRFSERFGMKLQRSTVLQLCQAIIESAKSTQGGES